MEMTDKEIQRSLNEVKDFATEISILVRNHAGFVSYMAICAVKDAMEKALKPEDALGLQLIVKECFSSESYLRTKEQCTDTKCPVHGK